MNQVERKKYEYVGDSLVDRDCLVVSDMIDTGINLKHYAEILKDQGANRIFYFAPHGLMTGSALENIKNSFVEEVIVTNTIQELIPPRENIKYITVGKLLAEVISLIYKDMPIN
jgi:ribose-phosphate pyrophosphokinase